MRATTQRYAYDWQGNLTTSDDDQHAFSERSLAGALRLTGKPNQVTEAGPGRPAAGADGLAAVYDGAGNVTRMVVSRKACADPQGKCVHAYVYDWNALGLLARARRFDATSEQTFLNDQYLAEEATVDVTYAYGAGGERVLQTRRRAGGDTHVAEVFGTLRLKDASFDGTDYARTASTEEVFLGGVARLAYLEQDAQRAQSGRRRLFFLLGDHLGSTASVIDGETGELVERTTYQAYGAVETDFRAGEWGTYREDYKFTGKETDAELGITYFGARYYHPMLGRWLSADPLTIHGLGADPNPYSYVDGHVYNAVDPNGLSGAAVTPGYVPNPSPP